MSEPNRDRPDDGPLNPALKKETETLYDTRHSSKAPIDTTSAHAGEGEAWPWAWLIVTVVGIILAIYFLI